MRVEPHYTSLPCDRLRGGVAVTERVSSLLDLIGHGSLPLSVLAAFAGANALLSAHRRDLTAPALLLLGGVLATVREVQPDLPIGLAIVAATAIGLALLRGSLHRVARPGLLGAAILIVAAIGAGRMALGVLTHGHGEPAGILAVPALALAPLLFVLALERPAPRQVRRRWYRKVPVE